MSRADQMPRIELEDLTAEMQDLALEAGAAVRGGEVALTHEGTHAAEGQTAPSPPYHWSGIIAILIG